MSDISMNVQKRNVWWVTCARCGFESKPTADAAKAERRREEHRKMHARHDQVATMDAEGASA